MLMKTLQSEDSESYIGNWLVAGGVTQSSSAENISEGMLIWLAAVIADGDVSAAAKVIIASGTGLYSHPRNDEPPPIECPMMADVLSM